MTAPPEMDARVALVAGQELSPWRFRPARADDAQACAPLIFASGPREFRFFLGQSDEQCIAFLRFAFVSRLGRFSWRRHHVACAPDGSVVAVLAAHDQRVIGYDDPWMAWQLLRFFGPVKTVGMLQRGLILESELPDPEHGQTLIAECATDPRVRGTGIFTALFAHAHANGGLPCAPDGEYVLDVLLDNPRARSLYERLGFVAQPRHRAPSAQLPADLISTRMVWRAPAQDAQARSIHAEHPLGATNG